MNTSIQPRPRAGRRRLPFLLPCLFLLLAFALAACGRTEEINLTDADNGAAITLNPQNVLIITLAANPASGYGWEVYEVDDVVLVPDGLPHFEPGPGTGGDEDAGGTQTFRFVPGGTGQTRLVLGYRGPDDPADVLPAQTYEVDVTVAVDTEAEEN